MGMTTDQWREMKRSGYDEQGEEDFDEYGMWGTDIINTNNSNYNNNILTDGFDSFNNNYSTVVYALSKIIFNNNIISTDGSDNNNNINSNKYNINFYDAFANNNKVFAIPFPFVSRTISLRGHSNNTWHFFGTFMTPLLDILLFKITVFKDF